MSEKCCEHYPDCDCDPLPEKVAKRKASFLALARQHVGDGFNTDGMAEEAAKALEWAYKDRDRWKHIALGGRKLSERTRKVIADSSLYRADLLRRTMPVTDVPHPHFDIKGIRTGRTQCEKPNEP